MSKSQTKQDPPNRSQSVERKTGKGRDKSNRFHVLSSPVIDDYEVCFPSLSGSYSKTQREPSSLANVEDRSKDLKAIHPISGSPRSEDGNKKEAWRKAQEAVRAESHYEPVIVEEIIKARSGNSPFGEEDIADFRLWLELLRGPNHPALSDFAPAREKKGTTIEITAGGEANGFGAQGSEGIDAAKSGEEGDDGEKSPSIERGISPVPPFSNVSVGEVLKDEHPVAEGEDAPLNEKTNAISVAPLKVPKQVKMDNESFPLNQVCFGTDCLLKSENVVNLGVGEEKGVWPSGKPIPKVVNRDVLIGARMVLDEMPKKKLVENSHKVASVLVSGTDRVTTEEGSTTNHPQSSAASKVDEDASVKTEGVNKAIFVPNGSNVAVAAEALTSKVRDPVSVMYGPVCSNFPAEKDSEMVYDVVGSYKSPVTNLTSKSWAHIAASDSLTKEMTGVSRLNTRSPSNSRLEYLPPIDPNFPDVVDIEVDQIDEQPWDSCLVGYFLDAALAFGLVRAAAMTMWRSEGLLDIFGNDSGFFFFKFCSSKAMEIIMEKGPWYIS
ncbi:hypothetical protein U1Q18_036378, partial [Sarracenia purpurea var. burkii]